MVGLELESKILVLLVNIELLLSMIIARYVDFSSVSGSYTNHTLGDVKDEQTERGYLRCTVSKRPVSHSYTHLLL
jgi:hypothetical protein